MLHTAEAIKSFAPTDNFTGMNLDNYALEHKWAGVGLIYVSKNRDSGALERSNFDTVIDELSAKFGDNNIGTINFAHWAYGWILLAVYNTGIEGIAEAVTDIGKRMGDYAVLDEMLYAEYEWADNHPEYAEACYSEDYDCPCGKVKP